MSNEEYKKCLKRIEDLKKVTSKTKRKNLLIKADILTKNGKLKKVYQS